VRARTFILYIPLGGASVARARLATVTLLAEMAIAGMTQLTYLADI